MQCSCPVAGFCATFNRRMVGQSYKICQGQALTSELCEQYRQKWLGEAGNPPVNLRKSVSLDCIHRGSELEAIQCQTCSGKVLVKTWACEIHTKCSLYKGIGDVIKICKGCEDLSPPLLDINT